MFVLSQSSSYTWPVEVLLPESGGRQKKETFDAEFKRLPYSRIREIRDQIQKEEISDLDLSREILVGWKGIHDERGDEIPFSEGMKEKLLDVQLVASAVVMAWFKSISGAKTKN